MYFLKVCEWDGQRESLLKVRERAFPACFIIIWVAIASQILIFLAPGLRRVPVWTYFR